MLNRCYVYHSQMGGVMALFSHIIPIINKYEQLLTILNLSTIINHYLRFLTIITTIITHFAPQKESHLTVADIVDLLGMCELQSQGFFNTHNLSLRSILYRVRHSLWLNYPLVI